MTLIIAIAISTLFGSGAYLMLKRDLPRVVVGMILISNAANLFIMAAGLSRGGAPIHPLPEGQPVSDPLVQSMTLTAVVISFAVAALALSLVQRVCSTHLSVDLEDLSEAEEREEEELEKGVEVGL